MRAFIWNESQAEQIRSQTEATMNAQLTEMREAIERLEDAANALEAEADALEDAPPIKKIIEVQGIRRNSDGEQETYTRSELVIDQAAMEQRREQIRAMRDQVKELRQSATDMSNAADELEQAIANSNALFERFFELSRRIDALAAVQMLRIQSNIRAYTARMQGIRDSFNMDFFSSAEGMRFFSSSFGVQFMSGSLAPAASGVQGMGSVGAATRPLSNREITQIRTDITRLGGAQTLDHLDRALSGLPQQDRARILQIISQAPEYHRDLIFAYADRINIANTNAERSEFRLSDQTIHFNLPEDRNNPRGAFWYFFHEVGHMIDWFTLYEHATFFTLYTPREELFSSLRDDVEYKLHAVAAGLPMNMIRQTDREGVRDRAVEAIMAGERVVARAGLSHEQRFQLLLQNTINTLLQGEPDSTWYNMSNPSNIFGGMTNNAVRGEVRHDTYGTYFYWFDANGMPTYMQNGEFFANHFASAMVRNEEMLQNDRIFFINTAGEGGALEALIIEMTNIANARNEANQNDN